MKNKKGKPAKILPEIESIHDPFWTSLRHATSANSKTHIGADIRSTRTLARTNQSYLGHSIEERVSIDRRESGHADPIR